MASSIHLRVDMTPPQTDNRNAQAWLLSPTNLNKISDKLGIPSDSLSEVRIPKAQEDETIGAYLQRRDRSHIRTAVSWSTIKDHIKLQEMNAQQQYQHLSRELDALRSQFQAQSSQFEAQSSQFEAQRSEFEAQRSEFEAQTAELSAFKAFATPMIDRMFLLAKYDQVKRLICTYAEHIPKSYAPQSHSDADLCRWATSRLNANICNRYKLPTKYLPLIKDLSKFTPARNEVAHSGLHCFAKQLMSDARETERAFWEDAFQLMYGRTVREIAELSSEQAAALEK